jgi:hypothetical protein
LHFCSKPRISAWSRTPDVRAQSARRRLSFDHFISCYMWFWTHSVYTLNALIHAVGVGGAFCAWTNLGPGHVSHVSTDTVHVKRRGYHGNMTQISTYFDTAEGQRAVHKPSHSATEQKSPTRREQETTPGLDHLNATASNVGNAPTADNATSANHEPCRMQSGASMPSDLLQN